jgi:hypothetical protein
MNRTITALVLGATVAAAVPAFAGPNGSSVPSFFPLYPQRYATRNEQPRALLGDVDQSSDVRAIPPAVRGKLPASGWQRRPSEAK